MDKHSTQVPSTQNQSDEGKIYSPIEDLQRAEGIPPLNRENLNRISGLPKPIKITGYVLFGLLFLGTAAAVILSFIK
ncbi:hypothetical protein ACFFJY_17005 [Fictibacillus aquaticus]|uniref:Uncharacterized protein n=1 Tax=Fictibacillus aquaticus TaxID=2021314 RepID=A0A235F723_9BACL|nr:hypothetical protein [Fictibacillus aquaticus]OYD56757.1 hypothetical protein CGZ90_17260 [Fictibacillus aquaticus]